MVYTFKTPEGIGKFYHDTTLVQLFPYSLDRLNNCGKNTYEYLPNYGLTRFITGVIFPEREQLEGFAKLIDKAFYETLQKSKIKTLKTNSTPWSHLSNISLMMNQFDANEDLRIKARSLGADALIYFKRYEKQNECSPLIIYKGVPAKKIC